MKPVRAVLDTNVLISGLCFAGVPAKVLELALTGAIEIFTSSELIEEFQDVLELKFPDKKTHILETLTELSGLWEVVPQTGKRLSIIKEDPDDDRVLECAAACRADFIVSGDNHLLALKRYRDISILSPAQFLKRFESQD